MESVTGIGGFFFRAKDPSVLAQWYLQHLGIALVPSGPGQKPWRQDAGPTAFAPFAADTTYFGDMHHAWMLNFRVRDLDAMAAQLRDANIEVGEIADYPPMGRFARVHDPEGNPIELWESPEPAAP